jgi:DNA-binding MarR family transcriptional regulator
VTDEQVLELGSLIPDLARALARASAEVPPSLRDLSLARRHFNVVLILSMGGAMNVGELSQRLRVTHATASLLVGELSRAGVVQRREDDDDRRRTIVSLAPAFRREITDYLDRRVATGREALARLEPPERTAFLKGMRALIEAFERSDNS